MLTSGSAGTPPLSKSACELNSLAESFYGWLSDRMANCVHALEFGIEDEIFSKINPLFHQIENEFNKRVGPDLTRKRTHLENLRLAMGSFDSICQEILREKVRRVENSSWLFNTDFKLLISKLETKGSEPSEFLSRYIRKAFKRHIGFHLALEYALSDVWVDTIKIPSDEDLSLTVKEPGSPRKWLWQTRPKVKFGRDAFEYSIVELLKNCFPAPWRQVNGGDFVYCPLKWQPANMKFWSPMEFEYEMGQVEGMSHDHYSADNLQCPIYACDPSSRSEAILEVVGRTPWMVRDICVAGKLFEAWQSGDSTFLKKFGDAIASSAAQSTMNQDRSWVIRNIVMSAYFFDIVWLHEGDIGADNSEFYKRWKFLYDLIRSMLTEIGVTKPLEFSSYLDGPSRFYDQSKIWLKALPSTVTRKVHKFPQNPTDILPVGL